MSSLIATIPILATTARRSVIEVHSCNGTFGWITYVPDANSESRAGALELRFLEMPLRSLSAALAIAASEVDRRRGGA